MGALQYFAKFIFPPFTGGDHGVARDGDGADVLRVFFRVGGRWVVDLLAGEHHSAGDVDYRGRRLRVMLDLVGGTSNRQIDVRDRRGSRLGGYW